MSANRVIVHPPPDPSLYNMSAEIIAIGSELTSGAKLDTNSQWLSAQLAEAGVTVLFHTTVADDLAANTLAVQQAIERTDIVLLTGGLGPTRDDLTREVLATAAGVPLELHEPSLNHIQELFASRGRTMPERNRIQAMIPAGAEVLPNPVGTAPGIWMSISRLARKPAIVAALPGVPSEMKPMFTTQVRPRLPGSGRVIRNSRVHLFGLGESQVEEILGELTTRGQDPEVGITAHEATITLRINAGGADEQECIGKISLVEATVRKRLGRHIFGVEDDELEHAVVRLLNERQRTLVIADAGTQGLLVEWLNRSPGAADCLRGGLVVPALADVAKWVGLADEANLGDPPQWADQFRTRMQADVALLVSPLDPARLTDIGRIIVSTPRRTFQLAVNATGNPAILHSRTAKLALNAVRRYLLRW